jgi:hypothetical protein
MGEETLTAAFIAPLLIGIIRNRYNVEDPQQWSLLFEYKFNLEYDDKISDTMM